MDGVNGGGVCLWRRSSLGEKRSMGRYSVNEEQLCSFFKK